MGTLKVDNLQKRDGTALITDGAASTNLLSQAALRSAGVGLIKISTQTASNASSVDFTGLDTVGGSAVYSSFKIIVEDVKSATDNSAMLYGRFGTGATPTYQTANYGGVFVNAFMSTASLQQIGSNGTAQIHMAATNGSGYFIPGDTFETLSGEINLFTFGDSNHPPQMSWFLSYPVSGVIQSLAHGSASFKESSEIVNGTALRLYASSGNINGKFTLYGVTK